MAVVLLDSATIAAVDAAASGPNGTREAGMVAALADAFAGNVTLAIYSAADVLLATVVRGAWVTDTVSADKSLTLGAYASWTYAAAGTPARVVFRDGATDIFQCSAGLLGSGEDLEFWGAIATGVPVSGGNVVFYAQRGVDAIGWATVPPITFVQGTPDVRDIGQYLQQAGTVTHNGMLPDGVTFNTKLLRFEYDGIGAAAATDGNTLTLTPALDQLPDVHLAAASSVTHPYTFGQVFQRGAVPAGTALKTTAAQSQVDWLQTWSDGSLLHAAVSVVDDLSTTPTTIGFEVDASSPSDPLDLGDLAASGHTVAVTFSGGITATVTLASLIGLTNSGVKDSPGLIKQRISGPLMSEWKFYSPVSGDNHLAVFITIRLYADGKAWTRVTVENGWWLIPGPTSKQYDVAIELTGAQKYSGSITQPHHTNWSLAYWHGNDPGIVPAHDVSYVRSTKLVPNYVGGARMSGTVSSSSEIALDNLVQTVSPMDRANYPSSGMGSGGFSMWIGPLPWWDVAYLETADPRAWRGMIANGTAHSRYAKHYRDETTMEQVRPTMYPTRSLPDALVGLGLDNSSNGQDVPTPTGVAPPGWAYDHEPAPPYLSALMTADEFFADECATELTIIFTGSVAGAPSSSAYNRGGESLPMFGQTRAVAWVLRSLMNAARVVDPESPIRAELLDILGRTFSKMRGRSVDGTTYSGIHKNNLGILHLDNADYTLTVPPDSFAAPAFGEKWYSPWQYNFLISSIGWGWDLDLPFTEQRREDFQVVRDFSYRWIVGLLGDSTGFCYRRSTAYALPIMTNTNESAPQFFESFAALRDFYYSVNTTGDQTCAPGAELFAGNADTTLDAGGWDTSSGPITLWPAIAYAVDHGAEGAADAFARLTGSLTYETYSPRWSTRSLWAVLPRVTE